MTMTDTEIAEIGAEPLTRAEHEAIQAYCERVTGVPDCFDLAEDDGVGHFPEEFTHEDKVGLIKSWFAMLGDWRAVITDLAEDLAEAAGNALPCCSWPPEMSEAATRYVGAELFHWHKALEGWRWGMIEFFLGRDQYGYRFDHFACRPGAWCHADGRYWING
jgi:hypothetical protein